MIVDVDLPQISSNDQPHCNKWNKTTNFPLREMFQLVLRDFLDSSYIYRKMMFLFWFRLCSEKPLHFAQSEKGFVPKISIAFQTITAIGHDGETVCQSNNTLQERIGAQAPVHFTRLTYFFLVPSGLGGGKGKYLLFNALYHLANTKFIKFIVVFTCVFVAYWVFQQINVKSAD